MMMVIGSCHTTSKYPQTTKIYILKWKTRMTRLPRLFDCFHHPYASCLESPWSGVGSTTITAISALSFHHQSSRAVSIRPSYCCCLPQNKQKHVVAIIIDAIPCYVCHLCHSYYFSKLQKKLLCVCPIVLLILVNSRPSY